MVPDGWLGFHAENRDEHPGRVLCKNKISKQKKSRGAENGRKWAGQRWKVCRSSSNSGSALSKSASANRDVYQQLATSHDQWPMRTRKLESRSLVTPLAAIALEKSAKSIVAADA